MQTSRIPAYAKLLIIAQTIVILFFLFWTFEEYTNNLYFQSYVNSTLQGSGFGIIALSSVGIFTAIAAGLFLKLRQTRMQLLHLTATEEPADETRESGSVLSPHVEQHLINMIRKSNSDVATGSLPVLKREEPSGRAQ